MNTHTQTNKNAYEIRLEILRMAHDTEVGKYHHKINTHRDNAISSKTEFDANLIETLYPNPEQILNLAAELYTFVEGK